MRQNPNSKINHDDRQNCQERLDLQNQEQSVRDDFRNHSPEQPEESVRRANRDPASIKQAGEHAPAECREQADADESETQHVCEQMDDAGVQPYVQATSPHR